MIQNLEKENTFGLIKPINIELTYSEINTLKNILGSYLDVMLVSGGEPDDEIVNIEQILIKIS